MTENSINLTFGYGGTDFVRTLVIDGVADSIVADTSTIVTKVKAVNASLAGGTSGGLDTFFVADDYDGTNGTLAEITGVKVITVAEENIDLTQGGN